MQLDLSLFPNDCDYRLELFSCLKKSDLSQEEQEAIMNCYEFANRAHKDQLRSSGEPYVSHPVWIAKIIIQLGLGKEPVEASLLHDCVEDTSVTLKDIADEFGDEVALLVDGLTEVKLKTKNILVHQTNIENYRNFLFSSVNDVRVLIIRLVDKLHNGMTIEFLSTERQHRYASRVLGIYSPVAEYVGLHYFKRLLEDISFKILFPIEAENLRKLLEKNNKYENKALILVREDVDKTLKQNNINDSEIEGRIKSLYSTYLKYKKNGKNSVKDRVGVRIILDSVSDCYMVLGLLHAKYKYLTEEFDDYISAPKANGYRSIQTTLLWKEGLTVEVQIRTREMHDFNEFGPASHIAYKLSKSDSKGVGYEWVKDLVKWQKSENKVNNYRIDVLANYIYVFTPKGDILQMPKYSTALDFAYRVHSSIGDRCNGAIINKKMAKLETELKTGDMVEIFTGKKINANKNWLRLVKTQFAKERIRKITNVKDADDKQ